MSIKVGIPKSLFYYQMYPLWNTFFEELGAEVITSPNTTKKILDEGVRVCVDEACVPVKLFHGHVLSIKDKVDILFIPRLTSISKGEYVCPKFGGLPDMVKSTVKGLPEIIDVEINWRKADSNDIESIITIGSFIVKDEKAIKNAYKKAVDKFNDYNEDIKKGFMPEDDKNRKSNLFVVKDSGIINIAVIGHPYNLYDSYINMNLFKKLRANGVNIITQEMIGEDVINLHARKLNKRVFWNFGRKALGSVMHMIEGSDIKGMIFLMSFGCGIDSFIGDLAERMIRRHTDIPFIYVTIDEHSGQAGLDTRLEAFIDMIRWRDKNEVDISAYG
ncbi:MAG TPA: acyl-CoA dehydratase activase-related protein [Pseudobacteroides sp.]|uniref:acyl-CoA dehydratase activase-related protein n=1 Tax=Pseudobacteroides sp. TaxID=1968840 RepID=UPI002F95EAB7